MFNIFPIFFNRINHRLRSVNMRPNKMSTIIIIIKKKKNTHTQYFNSLYQNYQVKILINILQ